jgi:hypothetical protein
VAGSRGAKAAGTAPAPARRAAAKAPAGASAGAAADPAAPWTTAWPAWRVGLTAAALFLLGAVVGVAAAFLHLGSVPAGVDWPVGLVFGLLCTAAAGVAGGMYVRTRAGAIIPALGWTVAVLVFTSPRAEGDLVVGSSGADYGFMVGGLFTQLAVVVLVPYTAWAARAGAP